MSLKDLYLLTDLTLAWYYT